MAAAPGGWRGGRPEERTPARKCSPVIVPGINVKARREARRLGLDILYEAEIKDVAPLDALAQRREQGWVITIHSEEGEPSVSPSVPTQPDPEALDYVRQLVEGVQTHRAEVDRLIEAYADRWAVQRMPVIDRNILRMALVELLFREDIPVAVAINEAVEMAKTLSTEDSGRFVNGLLGRAAESRGLDGG
jgi:transcription antitermination protein NusB